MQYTLTAAQILLGAARRLKAHFRLQGSQYTVLCNLKDNTLHTSSSSQQSPTRPSSMSEPMPEAIWRAAVSRREVCFAPQLDAELPPPPFTDMPVSTSVEADRLLPRAACMTCHRNEHQVETDASQNPSAIWTFICHDHSLSVGPKVDMLHCQSFMKMCNGCIQQLQVLLQMLHCPGMEQRMQEVFPVYNMHKAWAADREGALAVRCWRHVDGVDED